MSSPRICANPFLNDFIYDVLYHSSRDQKQALPKRFSKKLRNNATARKFVDQSSMDEKMELMTSMGYNWFFIFFEDTRSEFRTLKEIFEKYRANEQTTPAQSILQNRIYVSSDKKFAHHIGLMADAANTPQYSQSLLLKKAGYHIEKWKKQMKGPITDTAREHMEVTKYLMEMSLNMTLQLEYIEDFLGITRNDFKILSYLYTKQHIFVDYAKMMERFSNNLSLTKVTGCLRRLSLKGMINKTPKANEKKYQITSSGINALVTFYKNVLKANEF